MHHIVCRLRLCVSPHWGSLQPSAVPQTPYRYIGGLLLKGGERGEGGSLSFALGKKQKSRRLCRDARASHSASCPASQLASQPASQLASQPANQSASAVVCLCCWRYCVRCVRPWPCCDPSHRLPSRPQTTRRYLQRTHATHTDKYQRLSLVDPRAVDTA